RPRSRQLRDGLRQTGDGQTAVVVDELSARRGEPRTAEARDRCRRIDRAELARQRARIQIAGRLAARQQQARRQSPGRLNSAGSIGALILMSVMRRSPSRWPPEYAVVT